MTQKINSQLMTIPKVSQMSSGYNETQQRFQDILTSKLGQYGGVQRTQGPQILTDNGASFSATDVTAGVGGFADRIDAKLKGTPMEGLGEVFDKVGAENGINPIFLSSLAIHESNYGKSRIAQDKNNLFGFKAYDKSPYASAQGYGSFEESIKGVAQYLKSSYLAPEGKYYSGTSISAIGKRYATDPNWSKAIERIASEI